MVASFPGPRRLVSGMGSLLICPKLRRDTCTKTVRTRLLSLHDTPRNLCSVMNDRPSLDWNGNEPALPRRVNKDKKGASCYCQDACTYIHFEAEPEDIPASGDGRQVRWEAPLPHGRHKRRQGGWSRFWFPINAHHSES